MMNTSSKRTGLIFLALTATACAENRFVAKHDNFSVVMPAKVTTKQIRSGLRQYSCFLKGGSPSDGTSYIVTVATIPEGVSPMTQLQNHRDNLLAGVRKQFSDLTLVWSTLLSCSQYPGLQYTCLYDKTKQGPFGRGFELPSGHDVRMIRAGDRLYTLMVAQFIYEGSWTLRRGYAGTPEHSKEFFASFRLLEKVEVPKDMHLLGQWNDAKKKHGEPEQSSPDQKALGDLLLSGPAFTFRKNGEVQMMRIFKGTFKTDDNKNPRHIDIQLESEASNVQKGIYRFTDEGLQICLGQEKVGTRPTAFENSETQKLWHLKRPGDNILPKDAASNEKAAG